MTMAKAKQKAAAAPALQIFSIEDFEQGSDEWFAARAGMITASNMKAVIASGRGGEDSKTRDKYMRRMIGEHLTGTYDGIDYRNYHMERGKEMEPHARAEFELQNRCEVEQVALGVRTMPWGKIGASPDGLVKGGIGGRGLEIKSMQPDLMVEVIERRDRTPPPEHMPQLQTTMWVFGLSEIVLKIYWPMMPRCEFIVPRDELYIRKLADASEQFYRELHERISKIKRMTGRP